MPRTLDLTALRSFVAVAETGGVTRAAGLLHLTQSAVSMQLKRLEESLGTQLLDRSGRGIRLSPAGEQLIGRARQMLEMNDDILRRFTSRDFEGEVVLGVPDDIVYPAIPEVLRRFAPEFPRMKVTLLSSFTRRLKTQFARGEADIILTTEDDVDPGGETLASRRLVWVGAPGGQAWRARPLRLAFERNCIFRAGVQRRLEDVGIAWENAVDSDAARSIDATISADFAISARLDGTSPTYLEALDHGGALPELRKIAVNLYVADQGQGPATDALANLLRAAFASYGRGMAQVDPWREQSGAPGATA